MTSKDNELDEILFMAFVGLYATDEDGNFVSLDDKYGVLKDHLKQEIKQWAAQEANKAELYGRLHQTIELFQQGKLSAKDYSLLHKRLTDRIRGLTAEKGES